MVEKFLQIVNDEISMGILNFCKIPRTTQEIIDEIFVRLHNQAPTLYNEKSRVTPTVAKRLGSLEEIDALQYMDGKWKTTTYAINTLSKYFAL